MLLHRDHRTGQLYHTGIDVGKRIRPPLLVGKRTWKDTARTAGKGMLAMGALGAVPLIKQAYQLHQFKQELRR
jgi:hypothetical protein